MLFVATASLKYLGLTLHSVRIWHQAEAGVEAGVEEEAGVGGAVGDEASEVMRMRLR